MTGGSGGSVLAPLAQRYAYWLGLDADQVRQDRQEAELSSARKGQVGGGGRSEKVRTYNFKENRLTDHRIGLTIYKLDKVLAGELDEVVDALVADERARQLAEAEPAT